MIAAFKNASTDPKERYVHHAAGLGSPTLRGGSGSSSYIDSVVMRERDTTVPWTGSTASDSTLDERLYYAQNWRADVVAILGTDADVKEWIKYSSYGVPHSIPKGDYDIDGDVDAADTTALEAMVGGSGGWAVDFNHDAALNGTDVEEHETYRTGYSGGTGGRGVQSRSGVDNMLGYAGYVWDGIVSANHVRHRVYVPSLGRWTRRDPIGYVDGMNVHEYTRCSPIGHTDPTGQITMLCLIGAYLEASQALRDGHSDAYAHCLATCRIAQFCGPQVALQAGILKELQDLLWDGDPIQWSINDMIANARCIDQGRRSIISFLKTVASLRDPCRWCCGRFYR